MCWWGEAEEPQRLGDGLQIYAGNAEPFLLVRETSISFKAYQSLVLTIEFIVRIGPGWFLY